MLTDQPAVFFTAYLEAVCNASNATSGGLAIFAADSNSWKLAALHPRQNSGLQKIDSSDFQGLCTHARDQDESAPPSVFHPDDFEGQILAQPLAEKAGPGRAILLLHLADSETVRESFRDHLLPLLGRLPLYLEQEHQLQQAEADLEQFAAVLDLTILLYGEHRFQAAAMLFCNELASRYGCSRASLGWMEGKEIRVCGMSHTDKIEARMESTQQLVGLMEEASDQGVEICYPADTDRFIVDRDHKRYASEQKLTQVLTLPLLKPSKGAEEEPRDDAFPPIAGAITLELDQGVFSEQQIRALRLLCEQATPRLADLKEADGWVGARALRSARRGLGGILGVEHTWIKLLAIGLAALMAVLIFGQKEFQVRAPFALESQSVTFLAAPFPGYLKAANFEVGDAVQTGQTLFTLDTSELLLEKQAATADLTRHEAEVVRAEAAGEISQMRIAKAQIEQAKAQLQLIEHRLEQAAVKSAFDAVIVEGDLSEKINAPVEQGEVLVKLARLDDLMAELKVDERDAQFLQEHTTGRLVFATRPDLKFDLELERIEPSARPDERGNTFTVKCHLDGAEAQDWWRPGMTGVARLDCGKRSLLWIYTRKTVDRVRLFFW